MSASAPVILLGGTFDPIHNGHLRAAVELLEGLTAAEVRLVPAHIPPHRQPPRAAPRHRLALVRAAVNGVPGLAVDDCELRRGGPSYTVETLRRTRAALGNRPLAFALGEDAFAGLDGWYRWRELTDHAHLVVMRRAGFAGAPSPAVAAWAGARCAARREQLRERAGGLILGLPVTPMAISATGIRRLLGRGHSARFLVPAPVWSQMSEAGRYGYPQL